MGEKKAKPQQLVDNLKPSNMCISEVLKEERENVAQKVLAKKGLKVFCHWWETSAYKFKQPNKYKKG